MIDIFWRPQNFWVLWTYTLAEYLYLSRATQRNTIGAIQRRPSHCTALRCIGTYVIPYSWSKSIGFVCWKWFWILSQEYAERKMTALTSGEHIQIVERFHNFKSWSQLAEDSKGGYLKGYIKIPPEVRRVKLALFGKDGNPHPCLLFVTPLQKVKKVCLLKLSIIYRLNIWV